ncbi:MAG: Thioredoxin reductase, partial [uncultured Chloroflexia bacterium]
MITMDMLRSVALFAAFDDEHYARLAMRAAEVTLLPGEYLIYQGEAPAFFVILAGKLALTKRIGGREQPIATRTIGDYFGEVPILLGVSSPVNARATEPVRVLRLGADEFRALLADLPAFARTVCEEMLRRVSGGQRIAIAAPTSLLTLVADPWDPTAYRLRDFLARNKVLFDWQPPDVVLREDASAAVHPSISTPTPHIRFHDGTSLFTPTLRTLAERLELPTVPGAHEYDVAIVGGGPTGLSAAVYAASEGLHTLMIERVAPGGQAGTSSRIENYLGFPTGIAGEDLGSRAWDQAVRLGADIVLARDVVALTPGAACHAISLDGGDSVRARTVLLATGVDWRHLVVPNIDHFLGRGVYYGAARTEARACRGADVYLVGGGNSAGQAGTSSRIENYLGFPAGIAGEELGRRASDQAVRLGAD